MLGNALLRDPDRGLSHFKAIPSDVSHAQRGQNEFVHWIGRFEIAQKRLLAPWSDLLDLSDLPEVGTPEFTAAFTDEQRLRYQQLTNDEDRINYRVTLREQTITNRKAQHQNQFPLSDNLMSLIFLVEGSLEVKLPAIWTDEKQSRDPPGPKLCCRSTLRVQERRTYRRPMQSDRREGQNRSSPESGQR